MSTTDKDLHFSVFGNNSIQRWCIKTIEGRFKYDFNINIGLILPNVQFLCSS